MGGIGNNSENSTVCIHACVYMYVYIAPCDVVYLQVSFVCDNRNTLQAFSVAAARAALHLNTGWP